MHSEPHPSTGYTDAHRPHNRQLQPHWLHQHIMQQLHGRQRKRGQSADETSAGVMSATQCAQPHLAVHMRHALTVAMSRCASRPVRLGMVIIIAAMVNRTFSSSMEVGVATAGCQAGVRP